MSLILTSNTPFINKLGELRKFPVFISPAGTDRPYTVADALADYRADYQRRSGKATDRLDASAAAWIRPELGALPLDKLTKGRIVGWHQKIAETPPRLRTKLGVAQKHREADASPEAVRRRRSTTNRVLTILKAALNPRAPGGKMCER